jgi:glycosyltransferase involved in cell wall biosynthesis
VDNLSASQGKATTIRVLGISEFFQKYEKGKVSGKIAGPYNELNRDDFRLVGHFVPRLKGWRRQYNRLRAFSFDLYTWRKNISFSPRAFDLRTQLIEDFIGEFEEPYDVIFQTLNLFAPGTDYKNRCYVLYTDNTFLLSRKQWPPWAPIKNKRIYDKLIRRETDLIQNAACLFPCGQHVGQSMIDDYGVSPERIIVVGMSGNLPPADAETVARHRYDRQIALFAGYEFERKGGFVLLDAWPDVQRRLPDAQLLVVGHKQRKVGQVSGVSWTGTITGQQLLDLYNQATVFVMPSYFEPWGSVFNEAMSWGLSCIGTDTCAMPEMIHDGTNGAIVPVGDSMALAEKLIDILGNADYAAQLGQNAYRIFIENHTWEKIAGRMKPHIRRVATQHNLAPPNDSA